MCWVISGRHPASPVTVQLLRERSANVPHRETATLGRNSCYFDERGDEMALEKPNDGWE